MTVKDFVGLIAGLVAILSLISGFIFLVALLIVQPLEIGLLSRRRWMHSVTIEWVLVSFGLAAFYFGTLGLPTTGQSATRPSRRPTRATGRTQTEGSHSLPTLPGAVWVCPYAASPLNRHVTVEHETPDYLELCARYHRGQKMPPNAYPRSFVLRGKRGPQDLMVGDFLMVSQDVADVLRRFDLGQNQLISLDGIYGGRERDMLDKPYFILTLVNRKTAFSAEGCDSAAIRQDGAPWWTLALQDFADGSIAVTENALGPPDLWKDPATPLDLYVSDRLKAELDAQGIGKMMGLRRCRVVPAA